MLSILSMFINFHMTGDTHAQLSGTTQYCLVRAVPKSAVLNWPSPFLQCAVWLVAFLKKPALMFDLITQAEPNRLITETVFDMSVDKAIHEVDYYR